MNAIPGLDKTTKTLAGVAAVMATVLLLGTPLGLAEYYARSYAADAAPAALATSSPAAATARHS